MVIKNFGLFWRTWEITWNPGKGPGKGLEPTFQLLGRRGKNRPHLRLADFRNQQGIYILYGDYGPHYVGLTRKGLGKRLKDHLADGHKGQWDRFSWFGFQAVLKRKDERGIQELKKLANISVGQPTKMIGDMEALLIKSMGLSNKSDMKFHEAEEWYQVEQHEVQDFLNKLDRSSPAGN